MRNKYSRVPELHPDTPAGNRLKTMLEPRFNGVKVILEPVGTLDIQEKIESFAPFTDINFMLHRLKVGDYSVLSNRQGLYGDFAELPTNPVDVINLVHSAESAFAELDLAEKARFNNDWRVWLADFFVNRGGNVPSPDSSGDPGMNKNPDNGSTGALDPQAGNPDSV